MSALRLLSACYYNIVSRVTQRGKESKDRRKQKIDSQIHSKSLTYGVEKACREKRRLRSEAQLSLRSTSSVEWPRYIGMRRKVRCWLGEQLLFLGIGFSFRSKTSHVRAEGNGRRVSLWGDDSRSYNAPGLFPTFLR